MANFAIETEAVRLRPMAAADTDALHALWTEEPVRRFLWDGESIPIERTRAIVEESIALFQKRGFGIWGVRAPRSERLVGFAGFWYFRDPPELELLFGVASAHWRRGFATEASRGLLRYAFTTLGFRHVDASTDVGNEASIRVLEKLGMTRTRRAVVDGLDTVFYRVGHENWQH